MSLSPAQRAVMLWASGADRWRQKEIHEDLEYAPGTIAMAHQVLRRDGLIEPVDGLRGSWRLTLAGLRWCLQQGWKLTAK